jgi:membrane-bound lytic murein transglycosylase D
MKSFILLPVAALVFLMGCTVFSPSQRPALPADIDPVLSEDTTTESVPDPGLFSENVTGFDSEDPNAEQSTQDLFDQALDFCSASQDFWQKGELDNALQSLDQAYSLILSTDILDSAKLIQQKEDLRFMISRRILEIYASRITVVNGSHNAIPIIINNEVQKEIDCFTKRERRFFAESLKRSGRYRPMILEKLKEAGLPPELSWLPLVESGFKVNALSKARALGLWQFIPSTGYMYGLKRDLFIDERLDPEKATLAAAEYLKNMHGIFGDWSTVLAAYNCGEGRVLRIIRSQNINYLDNFWDLYGRLPAETARYLPRFLATLHIVNNLETYGFHDIVPDPPFEYETVHVQKQAKLKDVAQTLNVSEEDLKALNPELRYGILPKDEYALNIPPGKKDILLAGIDSLKVSVPPQKAVLYHRVVFGETLSTIARKYRTSTVAIARANNISRKNFIVAGKILKIPQAGQSSSQLASYEPKTFTPDRTTTRHRVKRGDSLWNIARKYDTTVHKIMAHNQLSGNTLRIGQVLQIPERPGSGASVAKAGTSVYHVKRGDSPFTIAMQHNMPVSRLLRLNQLTASSKIYPGQELYIE